MNNLAEGCDTPTNAVFARYLSYAIQSCSEVMSMTYVLDDVFGLPDASKRLREKTLSPRKQIKAFRKYLVKSR